MPASPAVAALPCPSFCSPTAAPSDGQHGNYAGETHHNQHQQMALECAARVLERHLHADSQLPGLDERLRVAASSQPPSSSPVDTVASVSGLHETDYPSAALYGGHHTPSLADSSRFSTSHLFYQQQHQQQQQQLVTVEHLPLPGVLQQRLQRVQCSCLAGVFPALRHGWLTIDSCVFLWPLPYGRSSTTTDTACSDIDGVASYDTLGDEPILALGCCPARRGIFQPHITHLLLVATALELSVVGVCEQDGATALQLLTEPVFRVASDGARVTCCVGTGSGRLLFGAVDGCLYELQYRPADTWLYSRCRKVNWSRGMLSLLVPSFVTTALASSDPLRQLRVDDERQLLLTLSQGSTLSVYYLGSDGQQLQLLAQLSCSAVVATAGVAAPTVDRANFRPLVDFSPVPTSDSRAVHAVATSANGVRLYFSVDTAPAALRLVHLRLPPGHAANCPPQRPADLHTARYLPGGAHLLLAAHTNAADVLWLLSGQQLLLLQVPGCLQQLSELYCMQVLRERVWAISELPGEQDDEQLAAGGQLQLPPLAVIQHACARRRFVAVSPRGVQLFELMRPVDQLRSLLDQWTGSVSGGHDPVRQYFSLYGTVQAGATALILACSEAPQMAGVAERAVRALLLYGGEITHQLQNAGHLGAAAASPSSPVLPADHSTVLHMTPFRPQQISTPRQDAAVGSTFTTPLRSAVKPTAAAPVPMSMSGVSSSPSFMSPATAGGGAVTEATARHEALYLYTSRLLRPVWWTSVVKPLPHSGGSSRFTSTLASEQLGWLCGELAALDRFLRRHSWLTSTSTPASVAAAASSPASVTRQLQRRMDAFLPTAGQLSGSVVAPPVVTDGGGVQHQVAPISISERHSLSHLLTLVGFVKQVVGLLRVLADHQMHVIVDQLPAEWRQRVQQLSFAELLLSTAAECSEGGSGGLCSRMIDTLLGRYLDDSASTGAVCQQLRDVCPTLFRPEDAVSARAAELVASARQLVGDSVAVTRRRQQLLDEALSLAKSVAGRLQLSTVCLHFQSVEFDEGVVQLCLAAATARDPHNTAQHYHQSGEPADDTTGRHVYNIRCECYAGVLGLLSWLLQRGAVTAARLDAVLQMALRSRDQLLHVHVYSWLLSNNMSQRLLQVESQFVEDFLRRTCALDSRVANLQLLWQHYERSGQHTAATRILSSLAERHGTEMQLSDRIECLARAILCVKSGNPSVATAVTQGELLYELEEKLEVARIQSQVLAAVCHVMESSSSSSSVISKTGVDATSYSAAATKLNNQLLNVTELYQMCEQLQLPGCKLAIVACAGHSDAQLVASLWTSVLAAQLPAVGSESQAATAAVIVSQLVRPYCSQPDYLPLQVIITAVETYACQMAVRSSHDTQPAQADGWPATALVEAGVSLQQLLTVYQLLHKRADVVWSQHGRSLHLLCSVCSLLEIFATSPSLVPATQRVCVRSECLNAVSTCVSELSACCDTGAVNMSTALLARFRRVQASLRRLTV